MQYDADYWMTWQVWVRLGKRLDTLGDLALRTRSPVALDALALAASGGRYDAETLQGHVRNPTTGSSLTPRAKAQLGRVWAGLARSAADLGSAAALYTSLAASGDLARMSKVHQQLGAQVMFLSGHRAQLADVLPRLTKVPQEIARHLAIDLANPYTRTEHPSQVEHDTWVRLLGTPFAEYGLEGPSVRRPKTGSHLPLFDHLESGAATPVARSANPLVSVVVPCYRPDEGLITSLTSLVRQSWQNLEILVVDDASGPEYAELFKRAQALDDRITVMTLELNGGSYLARNHALRRASGEFITFQDADDWSHPRRLELQVKDLLDHPEAPANHSRAIRAKDDLTHQWLGYSPLRSNASSLMFRRTVLEQVGPFAPVRKGGDSEFAERMALLVGKPRELPQPLAVTRLRAGTLSRGDFTYSWAAPDRLAFRGSYRAWHRHLAEKPHPVPPAVDFPWPPHYGAFPRTDDVEVGVLADFSRDPESEDGVTRELWLGLTRSQEESSPRVALWHAEGLLDEQRKRPEMHPRWYDLAVAGRIGAPVTRTQHRRLRRLLVLNPASLLLIDGQDVAVTADRVEVVLTPSVVEPDSTCLPVDLAAVRDLVVRLWKTPPVWVAFPERLGSDLGDVRAAVPGLPIDDASLPFPPSR